MEQIATDTYSFEDLRRGGFVYVDKTAILEKLANGKVGKQFFIARPRRFGKSLAVSTLQCLFEGRRDLFKGLAIEPDWDWTKKWPVLHLDMGSCQAATTEKLWANIDIMLTAESERLKVPLRDGVSASGKFRFLMSDMIAAADRKAKEKDPSASVDKMVLLVDEYDKPLLGHLGKPDIAEIRDALKEFYSVIKTCEGLQRFAFITGVSKFSKVSIFSDLNNLNDFSMDARFATLFGYTHEEVKANFPEALVALCGNYKWPAEETFSRLVRMYNGYRFAADAESVFNPVSLGKCLSAHAFAEYWFETGTPTFLIDMLERVPEHIDGITLEAAAFSVCEPSTPTLLPLLYQTGYLTITGSRREDVYTYYTLGFPDDEVRNAFSRAVSERFSHLGVSEHASLLTQMVEALRHDDVNDMLDALSCFFANIPANITVKREKYYQSLFYAVFVLIGARTHAECWTNRGRVDAVVETPCGVYVFEFKLSRGCSSVNCTGSGNGAFHGNAPTGEREKVEKVGGGGQRMVGLVARGEDAASTGVLVAAKHCGCSSVNCTGSGNGAFHGNTPTDNQTISNLKSNNPTITLAAEALAQIKEKGYAEKYLRAGKKVTLVGAAFDAEMRNLADRAIEVASAGESTEHS